MDSYQPSGKGHPTDKPSNPTPNQLRKQTWGIFEVAYEPPKSVWSFSLREYMYSCKIPALYTLKFLKDLAGIAPCSTLVHILCCLWLSTTPALSLYFAHNVLHIVQNLTYIRDTSDDDRVLLLVFVCLWLASALLSTGAERILDENQLHLDGHLRCHFLPLVAHASLQADMTFMEEPKLLAATSCSPSYRAPGRDIFFELCTKAKDFLTIFFELLILVHIITQKATPDSLILLVLGFICILITVLCPSNGTEGAGFMFWTKNPYFYRLSALHLIVFNPEYRETLAKDGLNGHLYEDYKRTADSLGAVKSDTFALSCCYRCPWYWEMPYNLIANYPMVMYALTLPWKFSSSSLATMILFQYGMTALRQSITLSLSGRSTLRETFVDAQKLYAAIEYKNPSHIGTLQYPHPRTSSPKGMKISLRDVSVRYKASGKGTKDELGIGFEAIKGATFDVAPGQLVVITGVNGSGKSSLLKLIPRLNDPSSGSILVDDHALADYDVLQLRRSIAYLSQNEEIYPVSLQENILMGLTGTDRRLAETSEKIEEAVTLGGADNLVRRLGWDAVINPVSYIGQSVQYAGYGDIAQSAIEEFRRNAPSCRTIEISGGERQRLLCSRTFMKIKNSDVRLIVADEPTSALDPIAERDIFQRILELREGKTVIFVSHRFGNLVKHADVILCVANGAIVESGTHQSLMRKGGQYADLYKAQSEDL